MSFLDHIDLRAHALQLSQDAARLLEQGRANEARLALKEALALQPDLDQAHQGMAQALAQLGLWDEAIDTHKRVLARHPDRPDLHHQLGALLEQAGHHAEAEACCRQALAKFPDHAPTHLWLADTLDKQHLLPQAEAHYRQATLLDADNARLHERLGSALHRQEKYALAAQAYQRTLALEPGDADTWQNLATVLDLNNQLQEAEAAFRQALVLRPDFADAMFGLALVLLRQGKLDEAWPLYEARHHPQRVGRLNRWAEPRLDCPAWRGEPLQGKSLVVWQEQGHGDMIQFIRYLPLLKAQGARHITLVCMDALGPLFAQQAGIDAVVTVRKSATLEDAKTLVGHDYWVFVMSLPGLLNTTPDTIPPAVYLQPDPARQARWRDKLASLPGPRIGLAWKGNAKHSNDHHRSLPGLPVLAPLWQVPGLQFVSVQKGQGEDQARMPPPRQPLLHLGSDIENFADSAALVSQLDLLICVDTAIAHLAGALGVPCWILLPAQGTDWRWLLEGETSVWYPDTMRLFRQATPDDWEGPVEMLRQALLTRYPA